ncbi:hypothetical protein [Streptomyces noursei]|uniref:hypothetical protein n=1 Tax=Streptomyces noursei TaxID=1971 RepID=UPI0016777E51|nr:hypothetical protein [Streptomyces noursei]MCZ1014476.1 hypothetical protein [Streptomyces noursei]GGW95323.1 hypothetical protein GCM10010341_15650 [Streptomyces noursei]
MVNFLDSQSDARRFAVLLADYDRRLQALERSTQAAHTSIEGGAMDIYDAAGNLKGSVGVQPDGGVALVPVNTAPPPTPMPPTIDPVLAGLVVGWDGQWDDSYDTPTDFSLMQVHLGASEDFTPDATTLTATITARLGGTVTVAIEGYDPVWVRLVAQNTASIPGPPSAAIQGTPRQAVPKDLIDGIIDETKLAEQAVSQAKVKLGAIGADQLALGVGNLAPDPSFEGPQTAQLIAERPEWSLTTPGNNSPTALSVDTANAVKDWFSLQLAYLKVLPGERHYLAFDVKVSARYDGEAVKCLLRYDDADGTVLGYGAVTATPVLGGPWARVTGQVRAPDGTVGASLRIEASNASAGQVWLDNVEARTVVSAGMVVAGSISATELAADSVTAEKIAALTITADKLAALSVTTDKLATNAVTATKIAAGTIDATHIKSGSITADTIAANALNGKVITGATVQTGTSGTRLVLDTAMRLYDAAGVLAAEAKLADGKTDVGFVAYNTSPFARYYAMLSRGYVQFGREDMQYWGVPGIDHAVAGGTVSNLSITSGSFAGFGQARLQLASGSTDRQPHVEVIASGMTDRCDLAVSGTVTAGNIVIGTVSITPAVAGKPQSVTITGLNVAGKTFRGFVTALSTVPGTGVAGCTATDVTGTGMTIWLTRKDTVKTGIHWMIIGS